MTESSGGANLRRLVVRLGSSEGEAWAVLGSGGDRPGGLEEGRLRSIAGGAKESNCRREALAGRGPAGVGVAGSKECVIGDAASGEPGADGY